MRIYQTLSSFTYGSGVGGQAVNWHEFFLSLGYKSEIYATNINSDVPDGIAKPYNQLPPLHKNDTVIHHLSIGSSENRKIADYNCYKILFYRNITPPSFFFQYSRRMAEKCQKGLEDAMYLRNKVDAVFTPSEFNRQNLIQLGYNADIIKVIANFMPPIQLNDSVRIESSVLRYCDGWTNIIFVGRMVPNKKIEDIIRVFAYYKRHINSKSRLLLVGKSAYKLYSKKLNDYISSNKIEDVIFADQVSHNELDSYYRISDVFLCLSEHEGFCNPLIEAMNYQMPVIAFDSCAVKETLGGSGILLDTKDPVIVSSYIDKIISDHTLRKKIIDYQNDRIQDLDSSLIKDKLLNNLIQVWDKRIK